MTVKFQNTEIISEDGRFLLTTRLDTTIHKFVLDSILDTILSNFFKYSKHLFYGLACLLLGFFSISNLHGYFSSMFEAFVILLIPVTLDPVTIAETKDLLGPLITYDFFGVLENGDGTQSNNVVATAARRLAEEIVLAERYTNVGINNIMIVNMIFHLAIFGVAIILMMILKLVISAHSTKGGDSDVVKKAFEGIEQNDLEQTDATILKVDKMEESELINKLRNVYNYMNMAGFINLIRFIFP